MPIYKDEFLSAAGVTDVLLFHGSFLKGFSATSPGFVLKENKITKLSKRIFQLKIKSSIYSRPQGLFDWNFLPREVVEASILELFKIRIGKELENLVRINSVLTRGWTS